LTLEISQPRFYQALKSILNENINSGEPLKRYILTYCSLFLQVQTGDNQAVSFKTHPNMNKELFANEYILGLKDPNRPFPTGQASDAAGVGLLKWRMQSTDESIVPLTSEFITIIRVGYYFVFMYL
jgi:hypothetical protein